MNHSELIALIMFFGSGMLLAMMLIIILAVTLKEMITENEQKQYEIERLRQWETLRHEETV